MVAQAGNESSRKTASLRVLKNLFVNIATERRELPKIGWKHIKI
jgi:hypothetical protein